MRTRVPVPVIRFWNEDGGSDFSCASRGSAPWTPKEDEVANPASYDDQEHDRRLLRRMWIKSLERHRWRPDWNDGAGAWVTSYSLEERDVLFDALNGLKVKYE